MQTMYDVGDKVLVRSDIKPGDVISMTRHVSGMNHWDAYDMDHSSFKGCVVTIAHVNPYNGGRCAYYSIEEDDWKSHWFDNCFVGLSEDHATVDIDQGLLAEVLGI